MKIMGAFVGAALIATATMGASIASEVPPGGWRVAACCTPGVLPGTCLRYCDPPAAAVRGERSDSEQAQPQKAEPTPKDSVEKGTLGKGNQDNTRK